MGFFFFFFDPIVLLPLSIHVTFGGPTWSHSVGKSTKKSPFTIVQRGYRFKYWLKLQLDRISALTIIRRLLGVVIKHCASHLLKIESWQNLFFCCCCYFSFLPECWRILKDQEAKLLTQKSQDRVGLFFTCFSVLVIVRFGLQWPLASHLRYG